MRTVADVIAQLEKPNVKTLPAPEFTGSPDVPDPKVMLAVKAMKHHTADAGWQLTMGFDWAGYTLCGADFEYNFQHVPTIMHHYNPSTVVMQDKREWIGFTAGQAKQRHAMEFRNVEWLKGKNSIFKMTVLKDAQQKPHFHRESADEIDAHGWITYYHPQIVKHVAPFVRPEHCVRTYHSVNRFDVPEYSYENRKGCIISGAISYAYPLRTQIVKRAGFISNLTYKKHPGYRADGCHTPDYLKELSKYKVSICTSSRYGYTLRKIIESTAAGCIVVTDLPSDDPLPFIDENLVRIDSTDGLRKLLQQLENDYDPDRQYYLSNLAKLHYDYRMLGEKLAQNIDSLRANYNG